MQLDQLTAQMTNLNDYVTQDQSSAEDSIDTPPTKPALLLGDSAIHGVHGVNASDGRKVAVHTRQEATLAELSEALNPAETVEGSGEIYLVCGSTEAGSDQSLEDVRQDLVELMSKAKGQCDSLTVSSVLPFAKQHIRID